MLPAIYLNANLRNITPLCPNRLRMGLGFDLPGQPVTRLAIDLANAQFLRDELDGYIKSFTGTQSTDSMGLAVFLVRGKGGKVHATLGVECYPSVFAESSEFVGQKHCPESGLALRLQILFDFLGGEVPVFPGVVQLLSVTHDGFDVGEIFAPEPWKPGNPYWQAAEFGKVFFHE